MKRAHKAVDGVCECGMRPEWPAGWAKSCTRTRRPYQRATECGGVQVSTHLAPEDAHRLAALAAERGMSRGALMRGAVLSLLDRSEAS